MKHLDLFSGIGGFALAARTVWGPEYINVAFVEIDYYCQQILNKNFPNSVIYGDIKTFTKTQYTTDFGDPGTIDLLTGGFPCQPFSVAGKRRGTEDDRHLWPEMLRVIREFHPRWIIGENVGGFVTWNDGMVLEQVHTDLESEGYEVQPFIIPACAVNAPHRRDRVWIVAHAQGSDDRGKLRNLPSEDETKSRPQKLHQDETGKLSNAGGDDANTGNPGLGGWNYQSEGHSGQPDRDGGNERPDWNQNWIEVATRLCGVFNGLRTGVDKTMSDGIYLAHAKTLKHITGQDLPYLWETIQSEAFQWSTGRFNAVQNKDYLFSILWQHAHRTDGQDDLPFESAEVQEAYVRNVWHTDEVGCPPQGWRYNKQYTEEHKDILSSMSHEVALVAEEVWRKYLKDRNPRLKALGNAIVPQVAAEIMTRLAITDSSL